MTQLKTISIVLQEKKQAKQAKDELNNTIWLWNDADVLLIDSDVGASGGWNV